MIRYKILAAVMFALAAVAPGAIADTLQVHMVQATNNGEAKIDDSLKPFEKLLQSNLPFKRFSLVDKRSASLPSNAPIPLKDYSLTCKGTADDLAIALTYKGREVLNSTVRIEKGKPLIVGGFPDADDKSARILLILTVQ